MCEAKTKLAQYACAVWGGGFCLEHRESGLRSAVISFARAFGRIEYQDAGLLSCLSGAHLDSCRLVKIAQAGLPSSIRRRPQGAARNPATLPQASGRLPRVGIHSKDPCGCYQAFDLL